MQHPRGMSTKIQIHIQYFYDEAFVLFQNNIRLIVILVQYAFHSFDYITIYYLYQYECFFYSYIFDKVQYNMVDTTFR